MLTIYRIWYILLKVNNIPDKHAKAAQIVPVFIIVM